MIKKQDKILKKTGLRHTIVNCQLSIVNSAKPFKHQFIHPLTVSERLSAKLRDTTDNTKYTTFLSSVLGYNYPKSRTRN